jgi:hypothetical protein
MYLDDEDRVTLGASSLMELNVASAVFVLLTCLVHQKQNICKTCGIVSCPSQEFGIYKEIYHVFWDSSMSPQDHSIVHYSCI